MLERFCVRLGRLYAGVSAESRTVTLSGEVFRVWWSEFSPVLYVWTVIVLARNVKMVLAWIALRDLSAKRPRIDAAIAGLEITSTRIGRGGGELSVKASRHP
jgi:hypothetical protein